MHGLLAGRSGGETFEPLQRRACTQTWTPPPAVHSKDDLNSNQPDRDGDQQIPVYGKQNFMAPFIFNCLFQLELILACGLI